VDGAVVTWQTTAGTITASSRTNVYGYAHATLTSSTRAVTATATAATDGKSGTAAVRFISIPEPDPEPEPEPEPEPVCTAPAPTTVGITGSRANETRTVTAACPAGQVGEVTINQHRTVVELGTETTRWTCPGPTSSTSVSWSGNHEFGSWIEDSRSDNCVTPPPACTAPATTTTPISKDGGIETRTRTESCPSGQTGEITINESRSITNHGIRTTSWTCPGPTSHISEVWNGADTQGTWTETSRSDTCVTPPPPPPQKSYSWVLVSRVGDQIIDSGPCTSSATIPSPIPACSSQTEGSTYMKNIRRETCAPVYRPGSSSETYQCVGK